MPKTYYDSELTAEQIEDALTAIDGVVNPGNNGKVLYIENGQIKAASASRWSGGAVLEPLSVTANGDYTPPTGTDGFNSVHVAVPGAGNIQPLSVTENGTYNPPSGVDGYAPVTVDVSGGGLTASIGELFRHIMFSNSASDKLQRSDRWFQRNSNEPVLFLSAAHLQNGSIAYSGYAGISFSANGITGTNSSYGDLVGLTQKATPNGTPYYVQVMNGMYPPNVDSGKVRFLYASSNYEFFCIPNLANLLVNAGTKDLIGNQNLIDLLDSFIDAMYQEYYAS